MRPWLRWLAALGLCLPFSGPAALQAQTAPPGGLPAELSFGGPFALTAHDGRRVTDADFRGRWMLVYFGYTHCPDLCPTDLATIGQALDALGDKAAEVTPLFVTVDPERDTPELLAGFTSAFHPRMIGLGGSLADVAAAAKAYKVHRRKVLRTPGDRDYLVDHGSLTYLMGPDGTFVTLFPTGTTVERMTDVLRTRLAERPAH